MWPTGAPHLRTMGDDGHSYPAQSRRRVVSPCARAVVRSRSRMAVNMERTCGIARFSLSATRVGLPVVCAERLRDQFENGVHCDFNLGLLQFSLGCDLLNQLLFCHSS